MKCPSCNAELPATAKFCGACGATLSTPPPPPQQVPAPPFPPPQYTESPSFQPPPRYNEPPAFPPPPQYSEPPPPNYVFNPPGGPMPQVEKRFKALRLIAMLIKIAAFVISGLLIIGALVFMIAGATAGSAAKSSPFDQSIGPGGALAGLAGGFVGGLVMLIYAVFAFVFLYAYAEVIYLFLGIEENTRTTNEMLRNR